MAKTDEVPVYWRDQDDVCEPPAHLWSRAECREKKKILGSFENHGKTFRLFALRPKIYPVTAADLQPSNCLPDASTISMGELLANVGIAGFQGEPAPRGPIQRAQEKIRAYMDKDMRESQAPTAYGRWYSLEAIQVAVVQ